MPRDRLRFSSGLEINLRGTLDLASRTMTAWLNVGRCNGSPAQQACIRSLK
jgi:hypothetical protein